MLIAAWLVLTRRGRQAASVASVGISTLKQRLGSSAVIVVGIAGVVGVLVALLAMAEGYSETLKKTGGIDTAIVMRGASASEVMSVLERESIVQISQAPGIARNAKGEPIVSDEIVVAANLPVKGGTADDEGSVQVRGVGEQAWAVRPQVRDRRRPQVHAGPARADRRPRRRAPVRRPDAGRGDPSRHAAMEGGRRVRLGRLDGVGDLGRRHRRRRHLPPRQQPCRGDGAARRAEVVRRLQDRARGEPAAQGRGRHHADYFGKQSEGMTKVIRVMGISVGAIMAIGAMFGALNTMFAAVAARAREIATLRAIGFSGLPVVVAVMLETMLLALLGGLIGGAIAWLVFNGYSASTMAGGSVGQLAFQLHVTPELLWTGLKWALAIGFIGGLFPAVRAARLPVTTALREL